MNDDYLDEDFMFLSRFIEDMAAVDEVLQDSYMDKAMTMNIESMETRTPCELHIEVDENNQVRIGAIPPLYYVETTVMPVFHHITLKIVKEK
ncbi:hypothetical protein [Sinomicrobium weinanense]|uniref:Uncharacterized protein n=1 Tax=Sinomicrobium weinanense TaxID=2842200 RepID=A0A926JP56_9FLAO|nr:hypothetical protein [Sinomicrobium weinanense]MBC9794794.1 hypothetical protein [Sinomicrobium weinanense]MBU3125053.1 hypothetical protein [Sinomicrobium weinanense]